MKFENAKIGMRVYHEPGNNGPISHGTIKVILSSGLLIVDWGDPGVRQAILASHVEQEEIS